MRFWKMAIAFSMATTIVSSVALAQSSPQGIPRHFGVHPPEIDFRLLDANKTLITATGDSLALSKIGDNYAKQGAWQEAANYYNQALDKWANNQAALYGMAQFSHLTGNPVKELQYYRSAIYIDTLKGRRIQEASPKRLMEYVLLLTQFGQAEEALLVYHYAAARLDYLDGKQHLKVLLPAFGDGHGLLPYTPERLQAVAHVALSLASTEFDGKQTMSELQAALHLYPDSPIANYYLGEHLYQVRDKGAKAAYEKAAQLGDDHVEAAVHDALKLCP